MVKNFCQELEVLACTAVASPQAGIIDLTLAAPGWLCRPGQFVMVRPAMGSLEHLWSRPFSVCDVSEEKLRILFQIVGRGTQALATLRPGEKVVVTGPLGRWFRVDEARPQLILAGGMGIAPFIMFGRHKERERFRLLFGHRLPLEFYPYAELAAKISSEAMQQTSLEDIAEFETILAGKIKELAGKGQVLACGPAPMLRVVQKYCLEYGTDGQISLENRMACGVGACLGCVATTTDGQLVQSCVQGPVFDVRALQPGGY